LNQRLTLVSVLKLYDFLHLFIDFSDHRYFQPQPQQPNADKLTNKCPSPIQISRVFGSKSEKDIVQGCLIN